MVAIAGGKAYCARCRRYLKNVDRQIRIFNDPEVTATALYPVIAGIGNGRLQDAIDLHAASAPSGGKGYFTSIITLEASPGCAMHQATLTAVVPGERGVDAVPNFTVQGKTDGPVHILG